MLVRFPSLIAAGGCAIVLAACGASIAVATGAGTSVTQASSVAGIPAFGSGAPRGAQFGLVIGLPQSGSRLGKSSAPVTLTLYGDLECSLCKQLVLGHAFSKLITHDVRAGRLQIRYVAFRTATPTGSVFMEQQVATLAAGRQQRFWQYAMLFLSHQATEGTHYVTASFLDDLARQVPGLNFARWQAARQTRTLAAQVRSGERSANRLGIDGTPTLIFHGRRGSKTVQTPFPDYRQLEHAINAVS